MCVFIDFVILNLFQGNEGREFVILKRVQDDEAGAAMCLFRRLQCHYVAQWMLQTGQHLFWADLPEFAASSLPILEY